MVFHTLIIMKRNKKKEKKVLMLRTNKNLKIWPNASTPESNEDLVKNKPYTLKKCAHSCFEALHFENRGRLDTHCQLGV